MPRYLLLKSSTNWMSKIRDMVQPGAAQGGLRGKACMPNGRGRIMALQVVIRERMAFPPAGHIHTCMQMSIHVPHNTTDLSMI